MPNIFEHSVAVPGREQMRLKLQTDEAGKIKSAILSGIGDPTFLKLLKDWRPRLAGDLKSVSIPKGASVGELMLRELLLRAQGVWEFPFTEEELCHCRAIPTKIVDAAILTGAHTPQAVSRETSASTACGTCRPDVEAILKCRLAT